MEMFAVKIFASSSITGQAVSPLGILLVEAFDETSALIEAIKQCAKYYYYEDFKFQQECRVPKWLLDYFREDYVYGTAFRDLSYKVLS